MKNFDTLAQEFVDTDRATRQQARELMTAASPTTVVAVRAYTDGRINIKEKRCTKKSTLTNNLNRVFSKAKAVHIDNYGKNLVYYEMAVMHGKGDYSYTTIRMYRDLDSYCIGYTE